MRPILKAPSTTKRSFATSFFPKCTSLAIFRTVCPVLCSGYYYRFLSSSHISWLLALPEVLWGGWWGGSIAALDHVPILERLAVQSQRLVCSSQLECWRACLVCPNQTSLCTTEGGTPISTRMWGRWREVSRLWKRRFSFFFLNNIKSFW